MDPTYYPIATGSENFPRRSSVSSQHQFYGSSSNAFYQQSGTRSFPAGRDLTDVEPHAASRPIGQAGHLDYQSYYNPIPPPTSSGYRRHSNAPGSVPSTAIGQPPRPVSLHTEWDSSTRISPDSVMREPLSPRSFDTSEYFVERTKSRHGDKSKVAVRYHSQRRPSNRDEFDGPHQLLDPPSPRTIAAQDRDLPHLPTNLDVSEQDQILCKVNDCLSQCAFNFVARYQFPIPIEPDKRQVRVPADREWTEWVYLLKRLATKRRIPARVLYNGQIKQFVTVLENSLEMRHAAKHQSRPVKDDRNVLQLISAGIQVAKILKDAAAMEYLDRLYTETERRIQERQSRRAKFAT
ncbi:hypothetical protein VTN77DRAFT_4520 [Rasamsonia byssochlamydoides]|uniref:uncharacterized protein n=1 Tax=Rasamsonia byssochlamydoides TaxID=89139 RepID=UPI00374303B4